MRKRFKHTLLLFLGLLSCNVFATEIVIDGVLNDIAWQKVEKSSITYQVVPQTLRQTSGNFYYQVYTTAQGIYLGVSATVSAPMRLRTQENDTLFSNDHIQVMLDMNNTKQTSYVFSVNHQGYFYDGIYQQNKELNLDWSSRWHYKTKVFADSWNTEIFIPWDSMSFTVHMLNEFGMSISRYDESSNAKYSTIPANDSMNSFLASFNKKEVIIESYESLDVYPYLSLSRDLEGKWNNIDLGAEVFWKPNQNQQVSVTINPDFGQVESDDLVVNFSAIESFFSEKRPFFNENQSLFEVTGPESLSVVHTPRIGGEAYYDDNYESEIDAALKYSFGYKQFNVGLLTAFENDNDNRRGRDFWLFRGQYLREGTKFGLSLNKVNTPSIKRDATIMVSDVNYAYSEDTELNFGVISSEIKQGSEKIEDIGWWITGSSELSEQQSHEFSLFNYGDELQLNDIGYVKRVNRKQFEYEYQYQIPDFNSASIRDITYVVETEIKTNQQNESLPFMVGAGVEIVTMDEFEYQVSIEFESSGMDDLLTRGNHSVKLPSTFVTEIEITTPEYSWGDLTLAIEMGKEGLSESFYSAESGIVLQVNDNLSMKLALSQYNSDSWFDWEEGNVINEYNFTEQAIEFGVDYQISDAQELRLKFESVIGKATHLAQYHVTNSGDLIEQGNFNDFSFAESAFQLRYKYALSQLTAFYLSYSFGGDFEDNIAKFGVRNLYRRALDSKDAHNLFAKIRLHF